jgi:hypothetical protein
MRPDIVGVDIISNLIIWRLGNKVYGQETPSKALGSCP